MTLRLRRFIYSTFIAIFFLVSPPLVFYTAGYRYDFKHNRVIETGSLVVKSYPAGAEIYLDDELYREKTPTIINTIIPGTMNLRVEKEGYHVWERKIQIEPRVTTFVETVRLFADTMPVPQLERSIIDYWWNERENKFVYQTTDHIRLFNTFNNSDTLIANTGPGVSADVAWSPDGQRFILTRTAYGAEQHFIINANKPDEFTDLSSITNLSLTTVQWNPLNDNSVYALSNGVLYRIPYLLKEIRLVHQGVIEDYRAENKRIIFIERAQQRTRYLSWIAPSDPDTIHRVTEILETGDIAITPTHSHRVAYANERSKTLTVIDPTIVENNIELAERTIRNVDQAIWSLNGEYLFYTDGYALYRESFTNPITIIPSKPASQLITRYSSRINTLLIGDDEAFVYYTVGETLRVIQIGDERSVRLINELTTMQKPTFLVSKQAITYIDTSGILQLLPLTLNRDGGIRFFSG